MADERDETTDPGQSAASAEAEQATGVDEAAEQQIDDDSTMQALVEYMARGLVEQPDDVSVTTVAGKASVIFELRVAPDEMGKIIGKDGRVAKAMRTLLKVAAARERKRAILEIV